MPRRISSLLIAGFLSLLSAGPVFAWDAVGHQLVARIAWDQLTAPARAKVIALLEAAPQDACLLNLFPQDSRPLDVRQREFFVRASTWPDIVRPEDGDTRPCIRFHHGGWHFINYFWEGISGATNTNAPRDRTDIPIPPINVLERLTLLPSSPPCAAPPCDPAEEERPAVPAWISHLVGDLHQPLHTSARVTTRQDERQGDRGGGLFLLSGSGEPRFPLHSYWDGIVKFSIRRKANESERAYIERVAGQIVTDHPPSAFSDRLKAGDIKGWSLEGLATTKARVYPAALKRGRMPDETYRVAVLAIAREAIALAGYRLADLLNTLYGM